MKKILLSFTLLFFISSIFAEEFNKKYSEYRFIENKGQIVDFDGNVRNEFLYYSKSENLDIYFRKEGITYIFKKGDKSPDISNFSKEEQEKIIKDFLNKKTLYYRLDVDFVNPSESIELLGEEKSESYLNFYYAHCPQGVLNVKSINKIIYKNVYQGVNFVFYFKDNQFKYDIILDNQSDINNIKLNFNGAKNAKLINNEIKIASPVGDIIENLPKSYFVNDKKEEITTDVEYKLENNIVSFTSKNKINNTLVIDPQISWTTYYDDCFWNGSGSCIDVKGTQVVITSYGFNDDFPVLNPGGSAYFQNLTAGSGDFRILKFDNNGVRIWATFYGGTGYDNTPNVKIDYSGNILVAGYTESTDIPVQSAGGYYDATYNSPSIGSGGSVILKFNSSGVRTWGSHYDYVLYPTVDIDHNNNVYLIGKSEYSNPPVLSLSGAYNQATVSKDAGGTNASADIFIAKFNSSTTRLWATNLGSTSDEILIDTYIGTDNYLNILAYGDDYSGNGIITANPGGGAYYDNTLGIGTGGSSTDRDDALIYRITSSGALYWGTAFSGTLNENMQQGSITADASNNIYIYGETKSTDLPFTNPGGGAYFDNTFDSYGSNSMNPFLAKFSSGGVLNWCTYFGSYGLGYGMNMSNYIGVNDNNNLILVSTDGGGVGGSKPLVPRTGDYNASLLVYMGVYIAEFNSNLGVDWSTYYAGTTDRHSLGDCALATGSCGYELYMTTNWEKYNSSAIDPPWAKPTSSSYQDTTWLTTGNKSSLITRFSNINSTAPSSILASPSTICPGGSTTLTESGGTLGSGASWEWFTGSCGGTSVGTGSSITVSPSTTTTYYVRADGTCNTTSCVSKTVTVNTSSVAATSINASQSSICSGGSSTLTLSGGSLGTGATWEWYTGSCGGTSVGTGSSITVSPTSTTTYYVRAEGTCNTTSCVSVSITVNSNSSDPLSISATNSTICEGEQTTLNVQSIGILGTGADWYWYTGSCGGTSVGTGSSITVSPTTTTTYYVRAEGTCNTTSCVSITINVNTNTIDPTDVSASQLAICQGETTNLTVNGGTLGSGADWEWYTDSCGGTLQQSGQTISVSPLNTTTYYVRGEGTCNTSVCLPITITVNSTSTAATNISGNLNICEGSSSQLIVTGGTLGTGANWQWYEGACGSGTIVGSGDSLIVNPTTTTVYYVRAEGSCDTTACVSAVVNVTQAPNAGTSGNNSVCFGDNSFDLFTLLGGSPSGGGSWVNSNGDTLSNSIFNPINIGSDTFTYIVGGTLPCSDASATVAVTVNPLPDVSFTGLESSYCKNDDAVDLKGSNSPNGVFSGINIVDNGDGTAVFSPYNEGTETIIYQYTDSNNCTNADTQSVVIYQIPMLDTALISNVSCIGNNDGSVTLTINGGTPSYIYQWTGPDDFSANSANLSNLQAGTYNLTLTDNNNCILKYSVDLTESSDACLDIPTVFTPNGDGVNDNWELLGVSVIKDLSIEIYNRWGDLIFIFDGSGSEYDANRWDGTYNGKPLPISSYVYIINLKNGNEPIQGIVTIKK